LKNTLNYNEFLGKAKKYCAAAEHCKSEVWQKLTAWGAPDDIKTTLINQLEKENYISEKRYADLYVRSKVNQNKWGVLKISSGLHERRIPHEIIVEALKKIDTEQYTKNLQSLILSKSKELKETEPFIRKQKILAFLSARGYEIDLAEKFLINEKTES